MVGRGVPCVLRDGGIALELVELRAPDATATIASDDEDHDARSRSPVPTRSRAATGRGLPSSPSPAQTSAVTTQAIPIQERRVVPLVHTERRVTSGR